MPNPIVLLPAPNTVFLTYNGLVLGIGGNEPPGRFRFLKDHYFDDGEYVFAGEVRTMPESWTPTPDVEPLDINAVNSFYAVGPTLGAVIRTQFTTAYIYRPSTYWYSVGPNLWALSGLGASKPPIVATPIRFEDKEP